tara:strand:- start:2524 stop:3405 length:882 start_codon:yes stop_codon:yes gene_type:complete
MTDNIILIHSKYSAYSKRLLKIANDVPHVKKICIDNKKIRNYILHSKKIALKVVPTLIISNNNEIQLYEGDDAFLRINEIIENNERERLEKLAVSEQNIKNTLERQYEQRQEKIEEKRKEHFRNSLEMQRQQLQEEFKKRSEELENEFNRKMEEHSQPSPDNNQKKLDYDEFQRSRERHEERQQMQEMQQRSAEKQLNHQQQYNNTSNNSIRGHNDSMKAQINRSEQRSNSMKSNSKPMGGQLSSLDDILGDDMNSNESESLKNTIENSINNGGTDIMAMAQQMQNAREDPSM